MIMPPVDYMADHLDGLAEALSGPIPPSESEFKRASLRGLAHLARTTAKVESDVAKLEKRVGRLEERDTAHDALAKRVEALEDLLAEKRAEVRGGWWVACLVALIISTLTGAGWAAFAFFRR